MKFIILIYLNICRIRRLDFKLNSESMREDKILAIICTKKRTILIKERMIGMFHTGAVCPWLFVKWSVTQPCLSSLPFKPPWPSFTIFSWCQYKEFWENYQSEVNSHSRTFSANEWWSCGWSFHYYQIEKWEWSDLTSENEMELELGQDSRPGYNSFQEQSPLHKYRKSNIFQ